jgi:mRNA-degrading endonuclease RelE of RelBE toxin-antitoxin system
MLKWTRLNWNPMPKRLRLKEVHFSPQAADDLLRLGATDDDIDAVREGAQRLAGDPALGDLILFQSPFLSPSQRLYRYVVGNFRLNCRFDFNSGELEVVSIEI